MNERIRELQIQAEAAADEIFDRNGKMYGEIVMEKFAELIVAECGHLMVDIMLHGGVEPEAGYDIMMKHFGVEE